VKVKGSDKFRLEYAPFGAGHLYNLKAEHIIQPPKEEMTFEECERWCGCFESMSNAPGWAGRGPYPIVEVVRTYEDELPKGKFRWQFGWMSVGENQKTLTIELTNESGKPMPDISLSMVWENQVPQPLEGVPAHIGWQGLVVHHY